MTRSLATQSVASSAFQSRATSPAPFSTRPDQRAQVHTSPPQSLKTVVVLGGSYAGAHAAEVLSRDLPPGWRVILVERNSHFHHVYHFPRYGVVSEHAPKAFIPYAGLFRRPAVPCSSKEACNLKASTNMPTNGISGTSADSISEDEGIIDEHSDPERHRIIQASVVSIGRQFVVLDRSVSLPCSLKKTTTRANPADPIPDDRDSGYGDAVELENKMSAVNLKEHLKDHGTARWREPADSGASSTSTRLRRVADILMNTTDDSASVRDDFLAAPVMTTTTRIEWDFLIYALGNHPPPPLNLSSNTVNSARDDGTTEIDCNGKKFGVGFLQKQGSMIEKAKRVVVIGGGALGIQYSTDIASYFTTDENRKHVTLVHSRNTFLPLFLPAMNAAVQKRLQELNIETKLGERVDLESVRHQLAEQARGDRREIEVRSVNGTLLATGDLILLCTGQRPNSGLMASFCPTCVPGGTNSQDHGPIKVLRSLQIAPSPFGPSPVIASGEESTCDCVPSTWTISKDLTRDDASSQPDNPPLTQSIPHPLTFPSSNLLSVPLPRRREREQDETQDTSIPLGENDAFTPTTPRASSTRIDPNDTLWKRVFAIGDCVDAFGAIKAGHTGWNQADIATQNILKIIRGMDRGLGMESFTKIAEPRQETDVTHNNGNKNDDLDDLVLTRYEATKPMMRLTLGMDRSISQLKSLHPPHDLEVTEQIKTSPDEGWAHMWRTLGAPDSDPLA